VREKYFFAIEILVVTDGRKLKTSVGTGIERVSLHIANGKVYILFLVRLFISRLFTLVITDF